MSAVGQLTAISAWPALAGVVAAELRVERGVWGKAHGAASDFRWLAASAGLRAAHPRLGRELNLGLEDRPSKMVAWRALGEVFCAVAGYPSRAVDAAGRSCFLEKQVLVWRPEHGVSPAAAAFFLLAEVAAQDDGVWWSRQDEAVWNDPGFALALAPAEHPPLVLSPERLAEHVAAGLAELRASLGAEAELAELRARWLGGARPAVLEAAAPLSPRALAALLLPLPREHADRLSLAGWLPSSRAGFAELGRRWDVAVVAPSLRPVSAAPAEVVAAAVPEPELEPEREPTWEDWTAAMVRDLGATTERLLLAGLWERWRRRARLGPRERLTTALAWLAAPVWSRPDAPAVSWETWEEVLDDVGTLDRRRVEQLCVGPEGRHTWPWITGREAAQLRELRRMIRDPRAHELLLGSLEPEQRVQLAEPVEPVAPEPATAPPEPAPVAVAAEPAAALPSTETGRRWRWPLLVGAVLVLACFGWLFWGVSQ